MADLKSNDALASSLDRVYVALLELESLAQVIEPPGHPVPADRSRWSESDSEQNLRSRIAHVFEAAVERAQVALGETQLLVNRSTAARVPPSTLDRAATA